jgi:Uma2 family endonuclease
MTALLNDEEEGFYLTFEEYLEFEERSEIKHEYINGYVQAMAGARREHNFIAQNISRVLGNQLVGKPCAVLGSDQRLRISLPDRTFCYYPDVTVDCSQMRGIDTEEPTVLFEITSPSTARSDNGDKLLSYLNLPSMRVYVMVDQKRPQLTVHRRATDGAWVREVLTGLDASLALPEIECALTMREVYDRVDFSPGD